MCERGRCAGPCVVRHKPECRAGRADPRVPLTLHGRTKFDMSGEGSPAGDRQPSCVSRPHMIAVLGGERKADLKAALSRAARQGVAGWFRTGGLALQRSVVDLVATRSRKTSPSGPCSMPVSAARPHIEGRRRPATALRTCAWVRERRPERARVDRSRYSGWDVGWPPLPAADKEDETHRKRGHL